MTMKKPSPRTAEDLTHPKGELVAWNGDKRKQPNPERWNKAPDMEDTGFASRKVISIEGTNPPRNVRPVQRPASVQLHPSGGLMAYSPWSLPKPHKPPEPKINKSKRP